MKRPIHSSGVVQCKHVVVAILRDLAMWTIGIVVCAVAVSAAIGAEPPLGTVLISRNLDESLNTSPGHWNHLAMYVGAGQVVEAQDEKGVILTPVKEYVGRKYQWGALYPLDGEVGERAAIAAKELVGLPYRKLGTGLRRIKQGLNCVGVIVVAESKATGKQVRGMRIPDHALLRHDLFKGVDQTADVPREPMSVAALDVKPRLLPGVKHFMVSSLEVRCINAMNQYRARFGKRPLVVHPLLMKCARQRAAVMVPRNAHEPGGIWPAAAVRRSGYDFSACAENFAWSFDTPETAVRGWSLSSGHARAMRGPYEHVGVGIYGDSYVALFARPANE